MTLIDQYAKWAEQIARDVHVTDTPFPDAVNFCVAAGVVRRHAISWLAALGTEKYPYVK